MPVTEHFGDDDLQESFFGSLSGISSGLHGKPYTVGYCNSQVVMNTKGLWQPTM